jgi:hypothetical protein
MFAYRRKRRLGCEQLEGRFAPSSVLVGGGSRSTFKDAEALETTQAEQAAFFLAASAVLSQSSSVSNVAPITFDQPDTADADGAVVSEGVLGACRLPFPETRFLVASGDWNVAGDTVTYETWQCTLGANDTGTHSDTPSVDPISPETPSEQGHDVDAVGALPTEELPIGGDDVAAEDFPPVVGDASVAGDEVAEPVVEDAGLPDAADPEDLPWVGNDFEDLGPIEPVDADTDFTDENGSNELAEDEVPVEYQSDDATDEAQPVDS